MSVSPSTVAATGDHSHLAAANPRPDRYEWLLRRRFRLEAGRLDARECDLLDRTEPGWASAITDSDCAHARQTRNRATRSDYTAWWNATGEFGVTLTFEQICERVEVDAAERLTHYDD
ncbi:MAG: hypothetical protein IR160_02070 [Salinibacterium sp.]|nr:hypothetical protein [Salinibacterium sp.]MBF0671354.1 hypothetical protein [Salinibacterium sp.]